MHWTCEPPSSARDLNGACKVLPYGGGMGLSRRFVVRKRRAAAQPYGTWASMRLGYAVSMNCTEAWYQALDLDPSDLAVGPGCAAFAPLQAEGEGGDGKARHFETPIPSRPPP